VGKRKKSVEELRAYRNAKLSWLNALCADGSITDAFFRVHYALVARFLQDESEECRPTDETLGLACGKSDRTVRRITAQSKGLGLIEKIKTLGASLYRFPHIQANETRPAIGGRIETEQDRPSWVSRPANLGTKTGHLLAGQEPTVEPTLEPTFIDGASPLPREGEASAPPEKRFPEGSELNVPENQESPLEDLTPEEKKRRVAASEALVAGLTAKNGEAQKVRAAKGVPVRPVPPPDAEALFIARVGGTAYQWLLENEALLEEAKRCSDPAEGSRMLLAAYLRKGAAAA
jgi:hypothetical protein